MAKPRGRKKKIRLVKSEPKVYQFSPRGRPGRPDEIELTVDELEAIRLVDYKGMKQWQACRFMGVSRPTLTRIIRESRKKIADALTNGKIIRIVGGQFKVG